MAMVAVHDDMFTEDVIADPYTYMAASGKRIPCTGRAYELWVSPGTTMSCG